MWSKGDLERGFATGDFRIDYCLSGFRACRLKLLDAAPIFPKLARCQLRYTRLSLFSLPGFVPGIFRVCGQSCGQQQISNQIQPAPKPPVRPCVKAFQAFANNAMDAAVDCPKPPALPTALYPVNMLQLGTSYILSHQIPLCNAFFVAVCSGLC